MEGKIAIEPLKEFVALQKYGKGAAWSVVPPSSQFNCTALISHLQAYGLIVGLLLFSQSSPILFSVKEAAGLCRSVYLFVSIKTVLLVVVVGAAAVAC